MKIYLDNCSLQRPIDSKTQLRIIIEAQAIMSVIDLCESGELELIRSETHFFETSRNPNTVRKLFAYQVLSKARHFIETNDQVEARAKILIQAGIKPLDALHLASAENADADYFCTCDDRLLKRAKSIVNFKTKVTSPTELILEIDK